MVLIYNCTYSFTCQESTSSSWPDIMFIRCCNCQQEANNEHQKQHHRDFAQFSCFKTKYLEKVGGRCQKGNAMCFASVEDVWITPFHLQEYEMFTYLISKYRTILFKQRIATESNWKDTTQSNICKKTHLNVLQFFSS